MSLLGTERKPDQRNNFQEEGLAQEKPFLSDILFFLVEKYAKSHGGQIEIGQTINVIDLWGKPYILTRVRGGYLLDGKIYQTPY